MARRHGRNSRLYVDLTGSNSPSPVPVLNQISLGFESERVDVTAFGDTNKTYVVGLPDGTGSYSGWWDSASAQLFSAAIDGAARKFYFYPDTVNDGSTYFFGSAFFDFSISTGVADAVAVSGNITAAGPISRVAGS